MMAERSELHLGVSSGKFSELCFLECRKLYLSKNFDIEFSKKDCDRRHANFRTLSFDVVQKVIFVKSSAKTFLFPRR